MKLTLPCSFFPTCLRVLANTCGHTRGRLGSCRTQMLDTGLDVPGSSPKWEAVSLTDLWNSLLSDSLLGLGSNWKAVWGAGSELEYWWVVLDAIILCLTFDCKEFISLVWVKSGTGQILDKELYLDFFQGKNKMLFALIFFFPPTEIGWDQLYVLAHSSGWSEVKIRVSWAPPLQTMTEFPSIAS